MQILEQVKLNIFGVQTITQIYLQIATVFVKQACALLIL